MAKYVTIYDLGEQLLLVSTDRISAFDWVLPAVMDTGNTDTGNTDTGNTGMVKTAWCWCLVLVSCSGVRGMPWRATCCTTPALVACLRVLG